MNDMTQPTALEALEASESAAAEAGPGEVGVTTVSCDVACVGVFFDGTNNSRDHVGMDDISWHTNVDFLHELYSQNAPPVASYKGQTRKFLYSKRYARGIAVEEDGGTRSRSGAIGTGDEGVYERVEETIGQINQDINALVQGKRVCDIVLDVFGFSRGASAARYFCNRVKEGAVGAQHGAVTIRFLGLFDSVSSIAFPGRASGTDDVPLTTSHLHGTEIVHITAEDEMRINFPLTRSFGREISMVGSHSDIGGGRYEPGVSEEGSYDYSPYTAPGTHEWIMEKWDLDGERSSMARNDDGEVLTGPGVPTGLLRGNDRSVLKWSAEHGLQNVSLRIMFDAAKRAGVPLPPEVPNTIAGKDVSLHGDLPQYYAHFQENGMCSDANFKDHIRHRYALFCGKNDQVNALEVTGQRRSVRV